MAMNRVPRTLQEALGLIAVLEEALESRSAAHRDALAEIGGAAATERARIRRALKEEVTPWTCWDERAFRRVLDEICPEEG